MPHPKPVYDLPLKPIHAHLSTLDLPAQIRAYAHLADFAADHLVIAASRSVLRLVPGAVQLSWRRAEPSQCDQPPVSDLTLDCSGGDRIPVPLHDELDQLDMVVPSRFAGLLPVEPEDASEDEREEVLLGQLAAGLGLSLEDYRALVHAANVLVERNPNVTALALHE
jgi:hypothetical protein